ncbi:hypothetical protein CDAR_385741 [Caerostris darwini]|uniref:Prolactin receptor n=1 Tax=Caerostris darwini TaxID=1538125 RepID=A0AAV4M8I2_9ARAC|nr:hypothetical protein CDAR_385741 [Caerostris darwini]
MYNEKKKERSCLVESENALLDPNPTQTGKISHSAKSGANRELCVQSDFLTICHESWGTSPSPTINQIEIDPLENLESVREAGAVDKDLVDQVVDCPMSQIACPSTEIG